MLTFLSVPRGSRLCPDDLTCCHGQIVDHYQKILELRDYEDDGDWWDDFDWAAEINDADDWETSNSWDDDNNFVTVDGVDVWNGGGRGTSNVWNNGNSFVSAGGDDGPQVITSNDIVSVDANSRFRNPGNNLNSGVSVFKSDNNPFDDNIFLSAAASPLSSSVSADVFDDNDFTFVSASSTPSSSSSSAFSQLVSSDDDDFASVFFDSFASSGWKE